MKGLLLKDILTLYKQTKIILLLMVVSPVSLACPLQRLLYFTAL